MRAQPLLSALATMSLFGAAVLLAATAPSRAMQISHLQVPLNTAETNRADGGCGIAGFSRPNFETESGYARPTLSSPIAARCSGEPASVWKS